MTDDTSLLSATAHPLNTDGITATTQTKRYHPEKCEYPLHIGLFFDGTGNNKDWEGPEFTGGTQQERHKDSNVARLFRAYKGDDLAGYYRYYIPGVGTPFDNIGEDGSSAFGMGFGAGGDARIVYGLLQILNAMHASLSNHNIPMFQPDTVRALCSHGWLSIQTGTEGNPNRLSPVDQHALDKVGMKDQGGLLTINGITYRTTFLKAQLAQLAQKITEKRHPKLVEVFIDVFGFSRGAAQARVFCNWLDECFEADTLAGVTAHIRFLGIFDTVAAVAIGPAAGRWANGHWDWGDEKNLSISSRVRHCEHYVAMHEQRESFPLEDVQTPGDAMPPNCRQFRFPGMHSDVGGAYLPNEQGKNDGVDNGKLSQIPLRLMYEAARAALVPLDMQLAFESHNQWDPFALSGNLLSDYQTFIQANGNGQRQIADCLIDILTWRYLYRNDYASLPFVQRAPSGDRADLCGAHKIFCQDIQAIDQAEGRIYAAEEDVATSKLSLTGQVFRQSAAEEELNQAHLAHADIPRDRRGIYELIKARTLSPVELDFFSKYCHDSYAGFKPYEDPLLHGMSRNAPWENGGYLKFRTRYAGTDLRLVMNESGSTTSAEA